MRARAHGRARARAHGRARAHTHTFLVRAQKGARRDTHKHAHKYTHTRTYTHDAWALNYHARARARTRSRTQVLARRLARHARARVRDAHDGISACSACRRDRDARDKGRDQLQNSSALCLDSKPRVRPLQVEWADRSTRDVNMDVMCNVQCEGWGDGRDEGRV